MNKTLKNFIFEYTKQGLDAKEIAKILYISHHTVKAYLIKIEKEYFS